MAMGTFLEFPALYIVTRIKRRTGMMTGGYLIALCFFLMAVFELIKLNPAL